MGINIGMNGERLTGDKIWIEDYKDSSDFNIIQKPRIGINYAQEDTSLPWGSISTIINMCL